MHAILVFSAVFVAATASVAQTPLVSVAGTNAFESLGSSTVPVGDIDGDGFADLVVGCPGTTQSAVRALSSVSGATLFSIPSPTPSAAHTPPFGDRVHSIGDVDADGKLDFAVATSNEAPGGVVRVYSGANGALLHSVIEPTTQAGFGHDVSAFGDLDGDGHDDYLVAAPYGQSPKVVALSGVGGGVLQTYTSTVPGSGFAWAIAGVGDIDADGKPDFAAQQLTYSPVQNSAVKLYSGATGVELYTLPNPAGPNLYFGRSLDGGEDIDGDGVGDLAATSYDKFLSGQVYLYSGADGAPIRQLAADGCASATTAFTDFGWEVRFLGDVDHDGVADVAGSAAFNGAVFVYSSATGRRLYRFYQPYATWLGPTSFTSLPDLDGDGRAEIVIGHWRYNALPLLSVGRVTIYSDGVPMPVGTRYGFGDGTGANPCPCGNTGPPDSGCRNSSGDGARLFAFGSTSVAADDLYFELQGGVSFNAFNELVFSPAPNYPASKIGDGLLSIGRDGFQLPFTWPSLQCLDGSGIFGPGLRAKGGWSPGETRYFQVRCFDPFGPCDKIYNFSNAVALTFTP